MPDLDAFHHSGEFTGNVGADAVIARRQSYVDHRLTQSKIERSKTQQSRAQYMDVRVGFILRIVPRAAGLMAGHIYQKICLHPISAFSLKCICSKIVYSRECFELVHCYEVARVSSRCFKLLARGKRNDSNPAVNGSTHRG